MKKSKFSLFLTMFLSALILIGAFPMPVSGTGMSGKASTPNYSEYRGKGMSPNEKTGVMIYDELQVYYKKSQKNVSLSTDYKTSAVNRSTGQNQTTAARYEECPSLTVDWAIYYDEDIEGNTVVVKYGLSMFDSVQYVDRQGTVTEGKSPIELTAGYGDAEYNAGYQVVRNPSGKIRYTTRYYEEKGIIFYIINHSAGERIGQEDDVSILFDYIDQGYVVVTLDFMSNENATTPYIEQSLVAARALFDSRTSDAALKDLKVKTSPDYIYFLPEGCRLERDVWYWDTSVWGVNGTMEKYRDTWDNKIAGTSYDSLKIGKVSTVENLISKVTQKDGETPIDYKLCMNIVYPSQPAEGYEVPVYIQEGTVETKEQNIETSYTRGAYTGFALNGYACVQYDHPFWPFIYRNAYSFNGSGGHYGMSQSSGNNARAAVRCARYYADALGYSGDLIGAAGISKATVGLSVLAIKNNKKLPQPAISGYSASSFEGDITENGRVVKSIIQPFMYYDEACSEEVSSDCTVAYISSGGGIEWLFGTGSYASYEKIPLLISCGIRDPYNCYDYWDEMVAWMTQNNTEPFLPLVQLDQGHTFPVGYDHQFDCDRFTAMVKFFDAFLKPDHEQAPEVVWITPTDGTMNLPVSGEWKVGPFTPYGWDFNSYYYDQSIQIKFYNSVDPQSVNLGVVVRTKGGAEVSGEWVASQSNTLFTFEHTGLMAGTEYVIEVTEGVKSENGVALAETRSVSFKTEDRYAFAPVSDTYVSANQPDRVFGKAEKLITSNSAITLLTYDTKNIADVEQMILRAGVEAESSMGIAVYALFDYKVDEDTLTYNKLLSSTAWESKTLIGEYKVTTGTISMDLSSLFEDSIKGDFTTFALVATDKLMSDRPYSFSLDFERPKLGTELKDGSNGSVLVQANGSVADAGKVDVTVNKPSSMYLWRSTGAVSNGSIVKESDVSSSQVFKVQTKIGEGQLIKFYNAVTDDYIRDEDVGKSFRITFDIRPNRELDLEVGLSSAAAGHGTVESPTAGIYGFYGSTHTVKVPANKWTTVSCVVTISEEILARQAGMATVKLAYPTASNTYTPWTYIDNLTVEECTPAMYVDSVEANSSGGYTLVTVSRRVALDAPITVEFKEPMDFSTFEKGVAVTNMNTGDRLIGIWEELGEDHTTFAFKTEGLMPSTTYAVSTTKKAKTLDGEPCADAILRMILTEGTYAVRPTISSVISVAEAEKHFGLDVSPVLDGDKIGILSFSTASLKSATSTKLRLTVDTESETEVEVYVLNNVKEDESLCYKTVKDKFISSSRMGTYKVTDGAVMLDLSRLPRLVMGTTVTLAIKLTDVSEQVAIDRKMAILVTENDEMFELSDLDRPVTDKIYNVAEVTAAQVVIGSDVTVRYYAILGRTQTDAKMRFSVGGSQTVVDGVKQGKEYVFTLEGLAPWQMGDNICAELILGDQVIAAKESYSVAENLRNLLGKTAEELAVTDEKHAALKTLLADILDYGAAAQGYAQYNMDALVNTGIVGATEYVSLDEQWKVSASQSTDPAVALTEYGFDVKTGRLFFCFSVNGADAGKYLVKLGGECYVLADCASPDGAYTVYSQKLAATAYDRTYGVQLIRTENGEETVVQTVQMSVFSYFYEVQDQADAEAKLARSACNYARSAEQYSITQ